MVTRPFWDHLTSSKSALQETGESQHIRHSGRAYYSGKFSFKNTLPR
jgi:hypothetical protein